MPLITKWNQRAQHNVTELYRSIIRLPWGVIGITNAQKVMSRLIKPRVKPWRSISEGSLFASSRSSAAKLMCCTPLFQSNRNLFCNVKRWYLLSMYRFENVLVTLWGLLLLLWKISWVCLIAARLCEHSSLVRFEKRTLCQNAATWS